MSQLISLVLPAYNEQNRLPASLKKIKEYIETSKHQFEVLVIVEKSNDDTLKIAREITKSDPRFQIIDNIVHRGKGFAVRSGMQKASGDIQFFMDVDLSTPLKEVDTFLDYFLSNPEVAVVIGNRKHPNSNIVKKQNVIRQKMGESFNRFVHWITGFPDFKDTQCGFKAFRKPASQEIFSLQKLDHFAFDVEVLMLAKELNYTTHALPVEWVNSTESKVRIVQDSMKMLKDLFLVRRLIRQSLTERSHLLKSSQPH